MHAFVDEFGLENMTTIVDDDGTLWSRFSVRVQPAWAFVTADGTLDVHFGPLSRGELNERLSTLAAA
ncbi:MAG: hypothetical protein WD011_05770 [Nitriliruptoraceae bacterium]